MFKNPFSIKGRIGRLEYIISTIIVCLFLIYIYSKQYRRGEETVIITVITFLIVFIWFFIAQGIKRCHDVGASAVAFLVPGYNIWLFFKEGDNDDNEYGRSEINEEIYWSQTSTWVKIPFYKTIFKSFFSVNGRTRRLNFNICIILAFGLMQSSTVLRMNNRDLAFFQTVSPIAFLLFFILLLFQIVQRLHDIGKSPRFFWIMLVSYFMIPSMHYENKIDPATFIFIIAPIMISLALIFFYNLMFTRGQLEENKYGSNPKYKAQLIYDDIILETNTNVHLNDEKFDRIKPNYIPKAEQKRKQNKFKFNNFIKGIKIPNFMKEKKNNLGAFIKNMNRNEKLIFSLLIGIVFFIVLSYSFSTEYIMKNGMKQTVDSVDYSGSYLVETSLNYSLGFLGFIFSFGISYYLLNKKKHD